MKKKKKNYLSVLLCSRTAFVHSVVVCKFRVPNMPGLRLSIHSTSSALFKPSPQRIRRGFYYLSFFKLLIKTSLEVTCLFTFFIPLCSCFEPSCPVPINLKRWSQKDQFNFFVIFCSNWFSSSFHAISFPCYFMEPCCGSYDAFSLIGEFTLHTFVLVLDPENAGQKVPYELVGDGGVIGSGQV